MAPGESETRPNPFLNHLIIDKIIDYTSRLPDVKSLRLISSQWNQLASPKLLKSSMVIFRCQKDMEMYGKLFNLTVPHWNFHWKATGIDLKDNLMKNILCCAEEVHISKGLITLDDFLEILKRGKQQLKAASFNEVFIEKLCEEGNEESDIVLDKTIDFVAEKLCRLEITSCDKDDNFPWNLVFPVLPHLQILHAQLQSTTQVTNLLESLLHHQIKLEELSCFLVDMNQEQLELLACLNMPLKLLDVSLASSVSFQAIEGLLSSETCKSIENLKIFKEADDSSQRNYISLPKLPSLKVLELLGDPVYKIFTTVNQNCPNLESLNLSEVSCKGVMAQGVRHMNLSSLCIEECFFPTNVLGKLAETFPNLDKLCLFLNDDNVGTVFQMFANLEELTILGTEITDDGITGGRHHHVYEGVETESHQKTGNVRPFVGDCKKLRMFNLYPQPLPEVTDATVYHGLLHVSELTSVNLPETAVTDRGLRGLKRGKPNLVKLSAKVVIDLTSTEHYLRSMKYQLP